MYCKGDKIVYPMYGAGVIEDLEHKEVDGNQHIYYVLRIPVGNLKISVSALKAEHLGIRQVYHKDEVMDVINSVRSNPVDMPDNWNQRYKENLERIKTGKLSEAALVYRNLLIRERLKGLSSAEKKLLTNAKQIIVSELILSQNIDKSQAEDLLINTLGAHVERV